MSYYKHATVYIALSRQIYIIVEKFKYNQGKNFNYMTGDFKICLSLKEKKCSNFILFHNFSSNSMINHPRAVIQYTLHKFF